MEYERGLMTAWGMNRINFEYIEKSWDKPSMIMVMFRFMSRKTKKSK